MQVYGVDFSGASDAGKYIWIAAGRPTQDGRLVIEDCERLSDRWGSDRDHCLALLVELIAITQGPSAFGFDFPFGVPSQLMDGETWAEFVTTFGSRYPTPEAFRDDYRERAGGRELKRVTDRETKTPFSVYNLRIYKQTFYGIRDILAPLVVGDLACVPPMQPPVEAKPWVLEICPASTLKTEGLTASYKGRTEAHAAARRRLLEAVEQRGLVRVPPGIRDRILLDREGDGLDSVIAAIGVARALTAPAQLPANRHAPLGSDLAGQFVVVSAPHYPDAGLAHGWLPFAGETEE